MGNKNLRRSLSLVMSLILGSFCGPVFSQWDLSGYIEGELRFFPNEPAFPEQNDATTSPSIALEPEIVYEWNNSKDRLTFTPFVRWDAYDDNRTHGDIREANWLHISEQYDLVVGVSKVFWGVTESRHLVDIINQTDFVEDFDGEEKLGQPMVNLNLIQSWGTLGVFVLPGFRERTFPDDDARFRGPLPIDSDNATYDADSREGHVDAAMRWSNTFSMLDIGLAYFRGTSRAPRFIATQKNGQTVLVPHYDQINQASIDLQVTAESTLWKLETISRDSQEDQFYAAVAGLEHTLYAVFGSEIDLGLLAEYLYDGRDIAKSPPAIADDDTFLGARLTFNDTQNTAFLAGAIVDNNNQATLFVLEAERRFGDRWKLTVEGQSFHNIRSDDFLAGFRKDNMIKLQLSRFF